MHPAQHPEQGFTSFICTGILVSVFLFFSFCFIVNSLYYKKDL
ncbi:hypothetical protein MNB_SUP05-SYMBIONT-7-235 [hydrothermal vent metagenome]|uniref:Uncharacterized protein n=1 Tax=hydrothermal vent metagenome TaxID=652676 RepID=A0A1W1E5M8_9ZZZZ